VNRIDREMSKYIHLSKYSRWVEEEERRETWDETVDRLQRFWYERTMEVPLDEQALTLDEVFRNVRDMSVMPSMRTMMTAGKALDRDNAAGFNCAGIAINHPRCFDEIFYLLMCGTGVGYSVERQYTNQVPEIAEELHESETTIKVRDSKIGWAKGLKELIALLYNGDVPTWDLSSVRPAGARLRTFGGRASGPDPLDRLFRYTVRLFRNAKGRRLNSLECHDLVCKIADTVIVGSVRRSACICLSNLTDDRMRRAKMGDWWNMFPHRALANNSTAYTEKPDMAAFTKEFRAIYQSKAGERGMVNKEALREKAESCGREYDGDYILNP
jgi:ribonucleoside-triphosphate reductase